MKLKLKHFVPTAVLAAAMVMVGHANAQEKLTVWWNKGFYQAEDTAMLEAIKKFEAKNKDIKIELTLIPGTEIIVKTIAALDSRDPPDVAYSDGYDFTNLTKWAYAGTLEDLSSIIDPIRSQFEPVALATTFVYNNVTQSRAYYAFPVKQQALHIHYWKDMLADAGFRASDIPKDWKGFWNFWCDAVQPAYRQKTGQRGFGIGHPLGVDGADSLFSFLTFADAYNVKMVNESGKLLVDDPAVRQGLINAVTDYTAIHAKGCTPPSSTSWKDIDNNAAFHNKTTVMTHNASISIVAKWMDDSTNTALTEAQRASAKKNYSELIATVGFPNKPDGSKMVHRSAVKVGVIFKDSKKKASAKRFVAFMLDEANLTPYVEGALGRWFPVTKAAQQSAFWKSDPHRVVVHSEYMNGTTPFENTKNYKFTELNSENVWAKGLSRVLNEKMPVDKAVDEMIARIKQVAAQ